MKLCAQCSSGEKYCQIELVWNWDLKKGRWGSCIANLEELIHRRGIVHCSSGWGGQDRDHNIPVQILKIDNTMTLSLSLTSLSLSVNSELLSLTWNMGFFVCDLSYCKKSSRGFLGWPRRAAAHAAWTWRSSARLPSCHCPATVCLLYMMYKCECLLGWWVEDAPRLFCQKTSLLRARKMMIIFISSRVMLKFVYRSWKQNDFFHLSSTQLI